MISVNNVDRKAWNDRKRNEGAAKTRTTFERVCDWRDDKNYLKYRDDKNDD